MSDIALPLDGVSGLPLEGRLLGDERLAKLAGRGSERAFAALYERHHQALYRYCRSIVGNDQDAQDALQSTMMRAYAALRSHERDLAVKSWLFRIAHNEAISLLRKRRPEEELGEHEPGQAELSIDDTLERRERLSALVADLRTLSERQRAALLMRELSGLSIAQIAAAMGVSSGAAKQTLFEARSSLHELAEGRAMECESVRQAISQQDGRVLRGRRIRAHLRACDGCRDFHAAIQTRSADLAAIVPPLPASLASALLARLLLESGRHAPAASAGSGAIVGGHAAASLLSKGVVGAAVLAAAAAGTAHFAATHSSHHAATSRAGSATMPHQTHASAAGMGADELSATGRPSSEARSTRSTRRRDATEGGGAVGARHAAPAGASASTGAAQASDSANQAPTASAHGRSTASLGQHRSSNAGSRPGAARPGAAHGHAQPSSPSRHASSAHGHAGGSQPQRGGSQAQRVGSPAKHSRTRHTGGSHTRPANGSQAPRHAGGPRAQHGSSAHSTPTQSPRRAPAAHSVQQPTAAPATEKPAHS